MWRFFFGSENGGGMGGMEGGGGNRGGKKLAVSQAVPRPLPLPKRKKKIEKNLQKKSRTQIISPVNLAGDIMYLLSLVFIKTRFEKSLCFTMDSFSRVRDGIVTHSAKCLEPQWKKDLLPSSLGDLKEFFFNLNASVFFFYSKQFIYCTPRFAHSDAYSFCFQC